MLSSNSEACVLTQEAPVHQCLASSANIVCFEVGLPTNGNFLKRSGLLLQRSHYAGTAVPNAVFAAAPGFSVHLALQQMDTRGTSAYASSFTELNSSLIKSQLLRLVGSQLILILQS